MLETATAGVPADRRCPAWPRQRATGGAMPPSRAWRAEPKRLEDRPIPPQTLLPDAARGDTPS